MARIEFIKHRGEEYYRSPAYVRDTKCGCEFYLEDEYYGTCQCPNCGQWFNLFGQEVLAPSQYDIDSDY